MTFTIKLRDTEHVNRCRAAKCGFEFAWHDELKVWLLVNPTIQMDCATLAELEKVKAAIGAPVECYVDETVEVS